MPLRPKLGSWCTRKYMYVSNCQSLCNPANLNRLLSSWSRGRDVVNGGATTNLYYLLDFWLRLKGPYVQIRNSFISLHISFIKYSSFLYVNFIHFLIFTSYKHIISIFRLNFYVYLPLTRARSKYLNIRATIWSLPPFVYLLFQKNAPKSSFHNL